MALKVALNIRTRDVNGANFKRLLSYVNPEYIMAIGNQASPPTPAPVPDKYLPVGYSSFFEWADTCVRSLNGLTTNTFADSELVATWSVNEELAD